MSREEGANRSANRPTDGGPLLPSSGGSGPVLLGRVAIVGLGLMGGSLALALRRAGVAAEIVGCGRQVLIDRAREMGALDSGSTEASEAIAGCDYIVLCTPVETSIALMKQLAPHLGPATVITDVGSTKQSFAEAACGLFGTEAARRVLPGHPLAGRELSGLEHATADLYHGCVWVLTPLNPSTGRGGPPGSPHSPGGPQPEDSRLTPAQQALRSALEAIGARVVLTSASEHDRVLAYTSHLPQMLSTALSLTLAESFPADDPALQIHGGGLRTMLRLAGSEPKMWEQIAASNRDNIAQALEQMESTLRQLRESLGDAEFRAKFEQAREFAKFSRSFWNHETVFSALVRRGEKHKDLRMPNMYVQLYPQSQNCAVLYGPHEGRASRIPLHLNPRRKSWDEALFEKMRPFIEYGRSDNKGPGKGNQNFDWYRVRDWDGFAKALGLDKA